MTDTSHPDRALLDCLRRLLSRHTARSAAIETRVLSARAKVPVPELRELLDQLVDCDRVPLVNIGTPRERRAGADRWFIAVDADELAQVEQELSMMAAVIVRRQRVYAPSRADALQATFRPGQGALFGRGGQ